MDLPDVDAPTPGRAALDDLRFELKRGDFYEQDIARRIEDGLDAQTVEWLVVVRAFQSRINELENQVHYLTP